MDMLENYGNQSLDKNELFIQFKENEGSEYVEAIRKHIVSRDSHLQRDLQTSKTDYKNSLLELEKSKELMEQMKHKFDILVRNRKQENATDKIIEEEESSIIKGFKDSKRDYKGWVDKVKLLKETILDEELNIKHVGSPADSSVQEDSCEQV